MSWDQLDYMLSKFSFSFNWKYHGERELRSLLGEVFRILEDQDERSLEQILIGCVHQASPGLTLNQPKNKADLPYEIKFSVHPAQEEFCISKIIVLSEARNLELYINGSYEKSSRGIMLTMNKGRKLSLFEADFDLSSYTETISNATIKFLSHPCKTHLRVQAVVMKVEKCQAITSNGDMPGEPVNLSGVKRLLGSIGRPLSEDAQKMLQSIENYQKSPAFKAQQLLSSQNSLLQNMEKYKGLMQSSKEITRESNPIRDMEVNDEERHDLVSPEEDGPFIHMLNKLCLNGKNISDEKEGRKQATPSLQQSSSAAYRLQSTGCTNKLELLNPLPPGSVEADLPTSTGHHGNGRSRQRPSSIGCVDSGLVDRKFDPEMLRRKWLADGRQPSRCKTCGCHGCLSVYNSITTNIFAAEERILQSMDQKLDELRKDMNAKLDTLFQMLDKRKATEEQR